MSSDMWRSSDTGSDIGEMISPRKDSLPSPNLEDSFFPFSTSSQQRGPRMSPVAETDPSDGPQDDSSSLLLEQDLILAAELGRALLERNEELTAQLEKKDKDSEVLEQEKHVLQRKLEVRELESGQREAELQADITALREQLDKQRNQGRDRRREESEQLTQLSNHNQKLVEQLAEAVALEHTLRSELRTLREDMDDRSLSNSISSARMESLMAENRLLQERYGRAEERLRSAQEDGSRLRAERDGLRQRVTELQTNLEEREGELDQERSTVFQLRTLTHSLKQRVQALGEEASLSETTCFPLSLQCEIQQTQAKEAIQVHSELLQEKESEIQKLKEELQSREGELQSLKEDLQAFRHSPGQPSYSFLEAELAKVRQERDSLTQQLMNTIKHKVALSQEVDAWQEDMRLVICQQVEEREKERVRKTTLQRGTVTSRSLRMRGEEERPRKGGFFSSFFSKE
ncbi:BICD family-like cargo adapter 2 isoform X1 [Anguilla rostrata]|uniref:BICD family-like cargo adapter 2 isoform X1 n=2 Tax=Anguilla anguilla TaxID=7936 RepID=UPI0015A925FC|nr:BICD family-like cargo adapter 2 isoform X1 [Anguilla anguilla]